MRNLRINRQIPKEISEGIVESKNWTIIKALGCVYNVVTSMGLNEEFWEKCANPLTFLEETLSLTKAQIVFLSILVEKDEPMTWNDFACILDCTRLEAMTYSDELDGLEEKRWIYKRPVRQRGVTKKQYVLEPDVDAALRQNKPYVPEKIDGLGIEEFIEKLDTHLSGWLDSHMFDEDYDIEDEEAWMLRMCQVNPHLPLCHEVLRFKDPHTQSLLLLAVYQYAHYAGSFNEGLTYSTIDDLYPSDYKVGGLRRMLMDGSHPLIKEGLLEQKCEDGMATPSNFELTKRSKEELLRGFEPVVSFCPMNSLKHLLKSHTDIKGKQMFYNADDQRQIAELTRLLSQDSLATVQERMEQAGMRKGFACLFYGAPGTGKTESVLQIARQTGRDIMQVDIAGMRDKYVGESEKNIKAVFQRYREVCKESEVTPILFFNEADALINKRIENVEHSVDKMDNAMQNIILQELEDLEGILIATTNLTCNLDNAFERRFIFKIEFHKPDDEVRARLWSSMVKGLSEEDARHLARCFDFSGGQIENIARKQTIDSILTGNAVSLERIERFCKAEMLNHKTVHRVGFC